MDREGWLYILVFLGIVAAGAWFVVPRLGGPDVVPAAPPAMPVPVVEAPLPVEPEVAVPAAPPPRRIALLVRGAGGRLQGPLRDVVGARMEVLGPSDDGSGTRLEIQPDGPRVAFGAVGHLWVSLGADALVDGAVVELPRAAAPLIVRVREADGRPATGVPVGVRPAVPGPALRTDAGGTVVLDHLPAGLVVIDLNSAERSGPVARYVAGRDRDVTLVLDAPFEVLGRAVDAQGQPLVGARVRGFGPVDIGAAAPADAAGRFVWRGPAVARLSLRVEARGRAPVRVEVEPPARGALRVDLGDVVLGAAGATIVGRVEAAVLEPDAWVQVEPEAAAVVRELFGPGHALDAARRVPLAADGTFEIPDVEVNLPLRVGVRGAGVPLDQRVVASPGERVDVHLAPPAGWALHGRVVDTQGQGRAGVALLVSAVPRDGDQPLDDDHVVLTGADGAFVLRGLGHRVMYVRAYVAGCRSLLARVRFPLERGLDLALEPALHDATRRVRGVVEDEGGRPLAGVRVRAAGIVGTTGDDGAFVLDGVESLAPAIELQFGYEPGTAGDPAGAAVRVLPRRERVVTGGEPLRLLLPASGTLRLEARDGVLDEPLAFVQVLARSTRDGRVLVDRGYALHQGRLALSDLPAEGLELALFTPGRRWTGTTIVPAGAERDLGVVPLHRGARVVGQVVNEDGAPVVGARVGLFDRGWQSRGADPVVEREQLFRRTITDAAGHFVLEGLGAPRPHPMRVFRESVDLAAGAPGHAPTMLRVDLGREPPEGHSVKVTLERGAFLGLDLTEAGVDPLQGVGAPVFGAIVDLESGKDGSNWLDLVQWGTLGGPVASDAAWRLASSNLLLEARSDDGYLVGPVVAGPYELSISRPGYAPFRKRLTIVPAGMVLYRDLTSGVETRFEGQRSYFRFALKPLDP